ncbi:fibroblast growth factor-binding protein 2b [Chanos chanos]|uniref:Fibroblast growth factor-binding protein 2b n=1 Tax=Chanos chanos TaxID=29144 RepID=A0A6J2WIR7_CHACN|nr:fibroblast growth factor-binding protein 2-like [Chanos chanos]
MRAVSAILLLACCVWATHAQAQSSQGNSNQNNNDSSAKQRGSIWDEPIKFNTKAKDACTMVISGQGDFTKLRVSCKNKGKSYWCDYLGKPNLCRAYNNNPRHYFTQIMWEMRKQQNACQGPRVYKPLMCKLASDEAQMVFHNSWPKTTTPRPAQNQQNQHQQGQQNQQQGKPAAPTPKPQAPKQQKPQPAKPGAKPAKPAAKPGQQPRKPTKTTTARPTTGGESRATKLAQEYCWKSFHGICAYFISWFQN